MKTVLLATILATLLVGAAAATVAVVGLGRDATPVATAHTHSHDGMAMAGADEHAMHGGWAGDMESMHSDAQTGMARPMFPPAQGTVPSAEDAKALEEVSSLQILEDKGFNPSNGVRSGTGTLADPYVISGYYVTGDLYFGDTDACFLVTDNYIDRKSVV